MSLLFFLFKSNKVTIIFSLFDEKLSMTWLWDLIKHKDINIKAFIVKLYCELGCYWRIKTIVLIK